MVFARDTIGGYEIVGKKKEEKLKTIKIKEYTVNQILLN
jgi:hypothetical protein